MKRLYLLLVYRWNAMHLWYAEIDADNAAKIVAEAEAELNRAISLAAYNGRRLEDAREAVQISGFRVSRHDRLLSLGVKP